MQELDIIHLYEETNESQAEKFLEKIESTTRVRTEYEKVVKDTEWVELMEQTIPYIDNIFRNPNRFIINEEEIVKIELARKITVESIKHLSKNTNLIQDINKQTGDVRPSKILNINKEESYDTYENKLIYTLIKNMKIFLTKKKKIIEENLSSKSKDNRNIEYVASSNVQGERIDINLTVSSKNESDIEQKNTKEILERIGIIERRITDLSNSEVYKLLEKKHVALVTSPIKKTNVVLKNVNFQYAVKLWNYLQENFDDKTRQISDKKDYNDDGKVKKLADENFLLQYLMLNSLKEDIETENENENKELRNNIISQMIEQIIELDGSITEKELKDVIGQKYAVIKYKKMATLQEIQAIMKKYIDGYLTKTK